MKIFITGATGYIGGKLALHLAESGNTVHALVRAKPATQLLNHPNIKLYEGDINDGKSITAAMQHCGQAYHVAAYAKVWSKNPDTYYNINVGGTVNVMECAKNCGVEKIVFTSTGSTLNSSSFGLADEDDAVMHNFTNDYETSKFAAESKIKDLVIRGQHIVIVNPTRVYGPGVALLHGALNNMIYQYVLGKWRLIPGNGYSIGNFVFIDDVVKGHVLAMENGKPGERYIIGGENSDFNSFFECIKTVSGLNYPMLHLPMPVVYAYAYFELLRAKIFNAEPNITPVWARKNIYHWVRNCTKAKRELGYDFTTLEEGLTKTIEWLVKQPQFKNELKKVATWQTKKPESILIS